MPKTKKSKLGKKGENITCEYLVQNNFKIIDTNVGRPWGEIDIIARDPDKTLVFVEVKTMKDYKGGIKPENQMTKAKIDRIKKTASLYAGGNQELIKDKKGWRIDLITIKVEKDTPISIKHYKNIL